MQQGQIVDVVTGGATPPPSQFNRLSPAALSYLQELLGPGGALGTARGRHRPGPHLHE
jgi:hypothetical protein